MKFVNVVTTLLGFLGYVRGNGTMRRYRSGECGTDKSSSTKVYEGYAKIETYPWLGVLYYTSSDRKHSTAVVLVTRQIVIASAMDIDKLPKIDIRTHSRVVLGGNCSNPGIRVKDYSYHPDFNRATYSAMALVQLETRAILMKDLKPICAPPAERYSQPRFYVMAQSDDCGSSTIKIHKMAYIDHGQCKMFYRKSELDVKKMWPTHTICAKALTGPECIWNNGVVLVLRQNNMWHLIGFGIYGPGCRAPSRFLDYSMYRPWLRSSVERIGRPTVTRVSRNHLILRRSYSKVQRYGPCDPEEVRAELFSDRTKVLRGPSRKWNRVTYNFTIFANLEYSCVVFRSFRPERPFWMTEKPYIQLKRWCVTPKEICYTPHHMQIDFAIEIYYRDTVEYIVKAYGQEFKIVDVKKLMGHLNSKKAYPIVYLGSNFYYKDEQMNKTNATNNETKNNTVIISNNTDNIDNADKSDTDRGYNTPIIKVRYRKPYRKFRTWKGTS